VELYFTDNQGNLKDRTILDVNGGSIVTFDVENDGDLDLVVGAGTQVTVLENDGNGHFTFASSSRALSTSIQVVDFNGDESMDLLGSSGSPWNRGSGSGSVAVLANTGLRRFVAPVVMHAGSDMRSALAGDIDGDGRSDILGMNHGLRGAGGITYFRQEFSPTIPKSYLPEFAPRVTSSTSRFPLNSERMLND
jgi:hypothetical protein